MWKKSSPADIELRENSVSLSYMVKEDMYHIFYLYGKKNAHFLPIW